MNNYNDYRTKIAFYDEEIRIENDKNKKLELIDQNIKLNKEYIALLQKPIGGYIVGCILLSILFFLGLFCYLPPIIIRKNKIRVCENRIARLEQQMMKLERE